jgi:hypothetical protein
MEKWKASNNVFGSKVYRVESNEMDVAAFDPIQAECLATDLNELEAYREERRWRVIGEEWPEPYDVCQVANSSLIDPESYIFVGSQKHGVWSWVNHDHTETLEHVKSYAEFTHWRPAPTDVPGEEG